MGDLVTIDGWNLTRDGDVLGVTLRELADRTGREHRDMLKKWRLESERGGMPNGGKFSPVTYTDAKGEERPTVWLNEPAAYWFASSYDSHLRGRLVEVFMMARDGRVHALPADVVTHGQLETALVPVHEKLDLLVGKRRVNFPAWVIRAWARYVRERLGGRLLGHPTVVVMNLDGTFDTDIVQFDHWDGTDKAGLLDGWPMLGMDNQDKRKHRSRYSARWETWQEDFGAWAKANNIRKPGRHASPCDSTGDLFDEGGL